MEDPIEPRLYDLHKRIWIKTMMGIEETLLATDASADVKQVVNKSNYESANEIQIGFEEVPFFSIKLISKERLKTLSENLFFGYVELILADERFQPALDEFGLKDRTTVFIPTHVNSYSRAFVRNMKYLYLVCREIHSGDAWQPDPHFETNDIVKFFLPTTHIFWDFFCELPRIPRTHQWLINKAKVDTDPPSGIGEWDGNPKQDKFLTSCVITYKNESTQERRHVLVLECKRDTEEELYTIYEIGENNENQKTHPDVTWIRMQDMVPKLLQSFIKQQNQHNIPWKLENMDSQWHSMDRILTLMIKSFQDTEKLFIHKEQSQASPAAPDAVQRCSSSRIL